MATVKYTVVKGDTLSEIAVKYKDTIGSSLTLEERIKKLQDLNGITNPDYIVVGQVLIISGTPAASKKNISSKAVIKVFGLQSNTDRTVFATWAWDKTYTDHYSVQWKYYTGDTVGFIGSNEDTTDKQSVYTAPENAIKVSFTVKPIAKTRKVRGRDTAYWAASWSTAKVYYFKNNPPERPPVPDVKIENYKLTAELNNLALNATTIEFQVYKNDAKKPFKTGKAAIALNRASYSCTIEYGSNYKVRCRAIRGKLYSGWTEFTDNQQTIPASPFKITSIKALTETSVSLDWPRVYGANSYTIEYTTEKKYFDSSSEVSSMTVQSAVSHAEVTGLESGKEWFFRVRAANDKGESAWTEISSVTIGEKPSAPTTWSSTTTVTTGSPLTLFWIHNSIDGSSQTYAQLELNIGGTVTTETIQNSTAEEEKDKTSTYSVDTSSYIEGTAIKWRVRTRGITDSYSDWSITRTVDVYAPPTLDLGVSNSSGEFLETLESFPIYITATPGPNTQTPIGYHLSVISEEKYETLDSVGNSKMINAGDEVYSNYFDISDDLVVELSANNVDLENNIRYTIKCVVSMNSGLTAESSSEFTVSWIDEEYSPNAEIIYDEDTLTTNIRPYCEDENGELIDGVILSLYRREFDGTFTELATELDNLSRTFVTDPHPALDYARYRVVAMSSATGAVSFYDMPGYPIGEKTVIIQWDDDWDNFETDTEDELEAQPWAGSLLKLPYNIDVSDKHSPDVTLVKYIGRNHPVSYYGTQLGESSTWNVEIDKNDSETLYALRRLAVWMGDVYVREPSGSGYWANINVSFSQKHCEATIPVSLDIVRVAGGA